MHLILFTHGSRDPLWLKSFHGLFQEVKKREPESKISLAFMEFATPTLRQVLHTAYAQGERSFKILPLFLASGSHITEDLPLDLSIYKEELPEAEIKILPALGEHPRVRELMVEIILKNNVE